MQFNRLMEERLAEREKKGNLRSLKVRPHCIDFTSNDYLGMARSRRLHDAIRKAVSDRSECAHGSGGSRLLTGNTSFTEEVERKIAAFHGTESALLYPSGYTANLGLADALLMPETCLLYDLHIHASVLDALRLSECKRFPFRHNDPRHLEKRLQSIGKGTSVFVYVESVYSLDGSIAPLQTIASLCREYGAHLIVDEAHAVGIIGNQGEGLVSHLQEEVFAQVYTYGKAFGVHGAAVAGSALLQSYLINFSRPFCYTTASPLHSIIAVDQAYEAIKNAEKERKHLDLLIADLQASARKIGIPLAESSTPVQAVLVPGNARVKAVSEKLATAGFDLRPIMSPTVKRGSEILRLCLHSFNTRKETENLLESIRAILKETP